jgi:hypothetical protein
MKVEPRYDVLLEDVVIFLAVSYSKFDWPRRLAGRVLPEVFHHGEKLQNK